MKKKNKNMQMWDIEKGNNKPLLTHHSWKINTDMNRKEDESYGEQ
jgi:hypothetical protein